MMGTHRDQSLWRRTLRGWWYLPLIHWGYPRLVPLPRAHHHRRLPLPIRGVGCVLTLLGAALTAWSVWTLVRDGDGTPAPHDPPQRLVCNGPYCHCRNPMELGNALSLLGWAIVRGCPRRAVAAMFFVLSIHAWIVLIEEPYLRRHFDPRYTIYGSQVPRWRWRRTAWRS